MIAPAPQIVALRLDVAMPSIFAVDGWSQRREAAPFRERFVELLAASGPAVTAEDVIARITICHTDRRRRNASNWEPLAARAAWESLVEVGWLDSRERFAVESIELARGDAPSTLIELEVSPR